MKCLSPKEIPNPSFSSGKWSIHLPLLLSFNPWIKKIRTPSKTLQVPCNACPLCMENNIAKNLGRLIMASYPSWHCYFLSFTIDESHFFAENMHGVERSDLDSLVTAINHSNKRDGTRYKYFLTSEYGSESDRPHYHGLFYNFKNMVECYNFCSKYFVKGHIKIEDVNLARFRYTANAHVSKCSHIPFVVDEVDESTGEIIQIRANKPFVRLSNGLGSEYVQKFYNNIIADGCFRHDGISYPLHDSVVNLLANAKKVSKAYLKLYFAYRAPENDACSHFRRLASKYGIDWSLYVKNPSAFFGELSDKMKRHQRLFNEKYINKNKSYNI